METHMWFVGALCLAYCASGVGGAVRCADKAIDFGFKLRTSARYQDQDGDGTITKAEAASDITNRYDANSDGVWSEAECVERNACDLGDSTPQAAFSCNAIFSMNLMRHGIPVSQGKVKISDIAAGYPGISTTNFMAGLRYTYQAFFKNKCVNRCLTVAEKVAIAEATFDTDNDKSIDKDDIVQVFTNTDTDKDGVVTESEYVSTWICTYGDSSDMARLSLNDFGGFGYNVTGKIVIDDIRNLDLPPFTTKEFRAENIERYARFEKLYGKQRCEDAVSGCAPRDLTVEEKNAIDELFVDISPKDGKFSKAETVAFLTKFVDSDRDGTITQRECVTRQECQYGDSTLVATFICNLFLRTEEKKTIADIVKKGPDSVSVDETAKLYERIYDTFEDTACEERCLSDEEKAEREANALDKNGDGVIVFDEYKKYLKSYGVRNIKKLTSYHWVLGQGCKYGTSNAQAHFRWNILKKTDWSSILIPRGLKVEQWAGMVRMQLASFARVNPDAALDRPCTPGGGAVIGNDEDGNDEKEEEEDDDAESN